MSLRLSERVLGKEEYARQAARGVGTQGALFRRGSRILNAPKPGKEAEPKVTTPKKGRGRKPAAGK